MGKVFTVSLPDIGEGVVEGEVIEWLKSVGDTVLLNEAVVIVMTDKATVELPAPHPGRLSRQHYKAGEIAIKDEPLYDIELVEGVVIKNGSPESAGGSEIPGSVESEPKNVQSTVTDDSKIHKQESSSSVVRHRSDCSGSDAASQAVKATPRLRHIAKEAGFDLENIKGTGKDGRITFADLKESRSTNSCPHSKGQELFWQDPDDVIEPLAGIRLLMAKRMALSREIIPHFSYFQQEEVERLITLKDHSRPMAEEEGVHLTFMPFFIRALSLCIAKYPLLNSSCDIDEKRIILHKAHNIGIAMSTKHGLIVPVLKNVESMSFKELAHAYEDLHLRAHQNKLHAHEMKESTITISNFGLLNAMNTWATPIINFPEVAILAVSRIYPQPVAHGTEVVVKKVVNLSWSFDHRVIDGSMAVQISHDFCVAIRDPAGLV